jgi:hypothetical protein
VNWASVCIFLVCFLRNHFTILLYLFVVSIYVGVSLGNLGKTYLHFVFVYY